MKVLHITSGLDSGGVAALLYEYYTHMESSDIHFDFVVHDTEQMKGRKGRVEQKFEAMGCRIYHVPPKKKHLFRNLKIVSDAISEGKYDVVHVHNEETSALYTLLAMMRKVPVRIVHAHYAYKEAGVLRKAYNSVMRVLIKISANKWFACSKDAGVALFGKKALSDKRFAVLHNAIDIKRFGYKPEVRIQLRESLGIAESCRVITDVGRLTYQKNPELAVEIFSEFHKLCPDSRFLMVGIGELQKSIEDKIAEFGLRQSVTMLGLRDDVPDILSASDAFLLPTRFEGLGIVYVEAQASGLPTFATDETVPHEVCASEYIHFISEKESPSFWAEQIALSLESTEKRETPYVSLRENGYDIQQEAERLCQLYMN